MKEQPEIATKQVDQIIRNTYRTLMTRGQKGCYVYCTDEGLTEYLRERVQRIYKEQMAVRQMLVAEDTEAYK